MNLDVAQTFLIYIGALVLVDPSLSIDEDTTDDDGGARVTHATLGWSLLFISLFVSIASAVLQAMYGIAQQEVEQSMLEHAAREADLMLSTREVTADNEKLRCPHGHTATMTLEEKGAFDIRKTLYKQAVVDYKWSVPNEEEGAVTGKRKSAVAHKFNSGQYPCFGASGTPAL